MHYDGSFEVPADKQKVYDFVTDPQEVTSIFPDVQDVKVIDANNFSLKAKVGISFIRGMMDVKMSIVERDPPNSVKMHAKGNGLSSSIELDTTFSTGTTASGKGTLVKWSADAKIAGLMASVGSRLMDAAAQKYVTEIITSLKEKLSS
ncbi:MAG TPA: carbon monoxide dehydrogenase subunit G [Nitrososphaerales archaeon]|nr:carbon monoxide dehydrogenase subunit G [Nitrososphaerales archaeon]